MVKRSSGLDERFARATETDRKHRTLLRVVGERGTGKTHFALTAPGPIFYVSFDHGLEGVIERFVEEGKVIYPKQYEWHPGDEEFNQEYAQQLRQEFEDDMKFALDNGARTVVLDKETDVWEMYRYAEFGGPSEAPKDYPALNQRYMAMINRVKKYDASLICIQGMRDEWITKKRTKRDGSVTDSPGPSGKRIPAGFGRLDELVFGEFYATREGNEFFFEFYSENDPAFGKCRQSKDLCGEKMSAKTFAELGTLLVEGSDESEWS